MVDTCAIIPLVGRHITPPDKPNSRRIVSWTPVLILSMIQIIIAFFSIGRSGGALLFFGNLLHTGLLEIFLVLFYSSTHSSSSKYWVTYEMTIPFSYVPLPHRWPLQPLKTPLNHPPLPPHPLSNPFPLKRPPYPLVQSPKPLAYIPRFLKRPYNGLFGGYSLSSTVDS